MPSILESEVTGGLGKKLSRRRRLGYKLARIAGDPSLLRVTAGLSPSEVDGWARYERQEPFGDECLYLAFLCSMFWNANYKKQNEAAVTPHDVIGYIEMIKEGIEAKPKVDTAKAVEALRNWGLAQIQVAK